MDFITSEEREQFLPTGDGIDHINVYSKAHTELGRKLTNFAHTPFDLKNHGHFESLEGYWYWLKTGRQHDELRNLHGFLAKKKGREFFKEYEAQGYKDPSDSVEFKEFILEAIRQKMRTHKDLLKELVETELPLAHYYYYGKPENPKVYHLPQFNWQLIEFEYIRHITQQWIAQKESDKSPGQGIDFNKLQLESEKRKLQGIPPLGSKHEASVEP